MTMGNAKKKSDMVLCPVGRFFQDLEESMGKESRFYEHLGRSRIEFLKAIKTLIDNRIEVLEKKTGRKGKKKIDKINVD
jgi:hypothetical protein